MAVERRALWRLAVPVATGLAGLLLATSASTSGGIDLRSTGRTDLADLARAEQRRVASYLGDVRDLRAQVAAAGRDGSNGDVAVQQANRAADAAAGPAGLTAVRGPGLVVELNDAPRAADGGLPEGAAPDDLVVHQQDVQAVVNALWAGGAEAMQLMDQRVISTSAVRCVGNTLILQGVVYSPPYRVTAIGDVARMRAALAVSPGVRTYRQYVDAFGLGYAEQPRREVRLPAYSGALELTHARLAQ